MKILLINPLDARSGLKVRARGFYTVLKALNYDVSYMESNYKGDDPLIISIPQKDTLSGYFTACLRRLRYSLLMSYDVLLVHKFLPVNIPCIITGKIRGKKVIVDWDDFDFTYQPTWFRRTVTKWAEQWMPRYVDLITTHNHGIKEQAEKLGAKRVKIVTQGINTKVFDPKKYNRNELRAGLGLTNKKVICCLCTLDWGGARDLDKILLAVSQVIKRQEDTVLLIIGGGLLEEKFRKMAVNLKITKIIFTGLILQDEVAQYLAASDLALIYMSDDVGNRMRLSLKLLEYLSMRKIVVGHLTGPSKDYFGEYCVLANCETEDFSEKIIEALSTPPKVRDARSYIVENYDWEVVEKDIKEALSEII